MDLHHTYVVSHELWIGSRGTDTSSGSFRSRTNNRVRDGVDDGAEKTNDNQCTRVVQLSRLFLREQLVVDEVECLFDNIADHHHCFFDRHI